MACCRRLSPSGGTEGAGGHLGAPERHPAALQAEALYPSTRPLVSAVGCPTGPQLGTVMHHVLLHSAQQPTYQWRNQVETMPAPNREMRSAVSQHGLHSMLHSVSGSFLPSFPPSFLSMFLLGACTANWPLRLRVHIY